MKHLASILVSTSVLCLSIAAPAPSLAARGGQGSLESILEPHLGSQEEVTWLSYAIPSIDSGGEICCGNWQRDQDCRLESRGWSMGHRRGPGFGQPDLVVYLRYEGRDLDRIRVFSETCRVDREGVEVIGLEDISPAVSLSYLREQIRRESPVAEEALAAFALHDAEGVEDLLEEIAGSRSRTEDLRQEAVFWLGELRGEAGFAALERLLESGVEGEVRSEIAFALAESPVPEALDALLDLAREDPDLEVREQALFWLGQKGGERAERLLLETVKGSSSLREEAIFALSELPDGRGVDLLLEIARSRDLPREARKEAIFWLGQSDDPKVWKLFEEILGG